MVWDIQKIAVSVVRFRPWGLDKGHVATINPAPLECLGRATLTGARIRPSMQRLLLPFPLARPIQRVDGADGFRAADAAGRSDFLIAVLART